MKSVPKELYDELMTKYICSLNAIQNWKNFIITLHCTYEDTAVRKLIDEKYVRIKGGK